MTFKTSFLMICYLGLLNLLSGCVVVTTAVGVTTTVVGGAIDVVDAVTPDVFDDDDEHENTDKEQKKSKDN